MSLNDYLTTFQTAKLLHIHYETVKRFCRDGRLPAIKFHNTWLISKTDFEQFAAIYQRHTSLRNTQILQSRRDYPAKTLQQIANIFGVTRQRIFQILKQYNKI